MPVRSPRIPFICSYSPCGKSFDVLPSRVNTTRFCSRLCQNRAQASSRKLRPLSERFWSKVAVRSPEECWLWTASVRDGGYGQIMLDRRIKGQSPAHVVSWFLHAGAWPTPGLHVCHTCDTPACVNPAHLWLGTQSDNMQDCIQKRRNGAVTHPESAARGNRNGLRLHRERAARGERNGNAKLTDVQWQEALVLWQSGEWTQTALAKRYGVTKSSISKRLKHLFES